MTVEREAWAAGLFEGEGWIEVRYSKAVPAAARSVRLRLGSTDPDVLERLRDVLGGTISQRSANRRFPNAKPMSVWQLGNMDEIAKVLRVMTPWFGERRRVRAEEALRAIANRPPVGTSGRTHCKNGHALTSDNLQRRDRGYQRCRACATKDQAAYRERKRRTGQVISA